MTGSLQIKNNKYYLVLNTYENGKRKPKWIATELAAKGNKTRAQKLLRDTIKEYEQAEEARAEQEANRSLMPFTDSGMRTRSQTLSIPLMRSRSKAMTR